MASIQKTCFLKYAGETKKVVLTNAQTLSQCFREKFVSIPAAAESPDHLITFYIEDKDYGVSHQLDSADEIYDGAIIEVHTQNEDETTRLKREYEELKAKLQQIEGSAPNSEEVSKRRRIEGEEPEAAAAAAPAPATTAPEPTREAASAVESPDNSWLVRLRGIPWESKDADIFKFLEGIEVASEDAVYLNISRGRTMSEAFVRLANAEAFRAALGRDRKYIGRRYIEVYCSTEAELARVKSASASASATPREGDRDRERERDRDRERPREHDRDRDRTSDRERDRPRDRDRDRDSRRPSSSSNENLVLRIRGLPYSVTQRELFEFFGKERDLRPVGIHIVMDQQGRPSGDGYLEVSSDDQRRLALTFHKKHIGSRYIELLPSSESEMRDALRPRGSAAPVSAPYPRDYDDYRDSRHRQPYPQLPPSSSPSYSHSPPRASRVIHPEDDTCLSMQGIPYTATENDITRFFQDVGVTPVRIHRKQNGGEAFVEFVNGIDTSRALAKHRAHLGSRYIELFRVAYEEMADIVGLPRRPSYSSVRASPHSYAPPPSSSHSSGSGSHGSAYVKLQGLPWKAKLDDILQFLRGYDVIESSVEIIPDSSGRPSGDASVCFRSLDSARRAIQDKNNSYMGDRYIRLHLE